MPIEQVKSWLYGKISRDYNAPMTEQQIDCLSEKQARTIYNNMQATHNLGSIMNITADDLGIVDTDKYCYVLTYSYPCQDCSQAGKGAGMAKGSGTRSALLWEVDRLLKETREKPQILLMENVPQVHGENNKQDFYSWCRELEDLGYHNYWQDLNAKDYGIPQNRNRCFMVSILGDYYYKFPHKLKLKNCCMDFAESGITNKFYYNICPSMQQAIDNGQCKVWNETQVAPTVTCKIDRWNNAGFVIDNNKLRYVTPKECFRMQAVKDKDYNRIAKSQAISSLYHLSGDSICVSVLMAIFGELFVIDYNSKITELVEELSNERISSTL